MSSENIIIKTYKITKFFMDFDFIPSGEHKLTFETSINIMTPKQDETKDSIVIVEIEFKEENSKTILSARLQGYVKSPEGLTEEEKPEILKKEAVPIFYENLREFVEDTMERTNTDFTGLIPCANDMNFE